MTFRVGRAVPKDQCPKQINKPAKQTSRMLKNPFLTKESEQILTFKVKREEHVCFDEDLFGRKSSQGTGKLKETSSVQIQVKEAKLVVRMKLRKPQEDLVRMSRVEEATISTNF